MIDEKKLIEKLKQEILETYHEDCILALERAIEIVKEQPKVGEWIPVDERLPEIRKHCLVTVRYTGFMGMHGFWVKTGYMESENDWWGDCIGGEVIAWMPLPKPYGET